MAAPLGNKFAVGNYGGRPPKWTKELIEKEAELFIEWAQLETSMILRQFAGIRGYGHHYIYEWAKTNEVFSDAFKFANTLIGSRREAFILEKAVPRDMGMYFSELDQYEREKDSSNEKKYSLADIAEMMKSGLLTQK